MQTVHEKDPEIDITHNIIGIDIGCEPGDIIPRLELLKGYDNVRTSQAAGPWCMENENADVDELIADLRKNLIDYRSTFIGECGLDWYWDYGTRDGQKALFQRQIDMSNEMGLPIIIHSRGADEDMLEMLSKNHFDYSGIMHCYSSSINELGAILDKGFYVSFSGNVTYKSNKAIQEAAKAVPADRLLFETDSPYLAPVPKRGKTNRPEYTEYTSQFLADLRGVDVEEMRNQCIENYRTLLSRSKGIL